MVTLIDYPEECSDFSESLNDQENAVETTILADVRSTTRMEFYNYGAPENRPEYVIRINRFEYKGQMHCRYNGRIYTIVREYPLDSKYIELTLAPDLGGPMR